jgi:succinoglycan biosynthesis transport protein ExoP
VSPRRDGFAPLVGSAPFRLPIGHFAVRYRSPLGRPFLPTAERPPSLASRRAKFQIAPLGPALNPETESGTASDIRDFVAPVWRRRWLLVAIITTSTVATFMASSRQPEIYRSSTQIFVSNTQIESIIGGGEAVGSDRTTQDQARLILSRPVAEAVRRRLGFRGASSAMLKSMQALPEAGSNFVTVIAERPRAAEAAALANAFVQEYIRYRGNQLAREAQAAISRLRAELATVSRREENSQQREDLLDTIRQLRAARAVSPSNVRQTNQAEAAPAPFSPRPRRDAVFGFAISAILGLALIFTLERFDRRIKRYEDVEAIYGVALLANIPHVSQPSKLSQHAAIVPEMLVEPFRSLRTNIQLASLDQPIEQIIVTSAVAGEGKSMIVRNLALTYREWGLSVVVVEADLRRPTLASLFGVSAPGQGLTAVLTGEQTINDALVDIEFDIAGAEYLDRVRIGGTGADAAQPTRRAGRLALMPAGSAPPNPQAVLAAARTRAMIDDLGAQFDIVLIDTPPLLAVSDAMSLLPHVSGVLIVTRIGVTERSAAERLMAVCQLDPGVRVLGVIANDLETGPGAAYPYVYGYEST